MPRENRKRGKKNKAKPIGQVHECQSHLHYDHFGPTDAQPVARPPPIPGGDVERPSSSAPFGPLDPDVKAYFRTVDDQLRDWQEGRLNAFDADEGDPNEGIENMFYLAKTILAADIFCSPERRMFFTAVLSEMTGKELQLATDPDCSPVLERMLYSMDDFIRRVFTDSLAGS